MTTTFDLIMTGITSGIAGLFIGGCWGVSDATDIFEKNKKLKEEIGKIKNFAGLHIGQKVYVVIENTLKYGEITQITYGEDIEFIKIKEEIFYINQIFTDINEALKHIK